MVQSPQELRFVAGVASQDRRGAITEQQPVLPLPSGLLEFLHPDRAHAGRSPVRARHPAHHPGRVFLQQSRLKPPREGEELPRRHLPGRGEHAEDLELVMQVLRTRKRTGQRTQGLRQTLRPAMFPARRGRVARHVPHRGIPPDHQRLVLEGGDQAVGAQCPARKIFGHQTLHPGGIHLPRMGQNLPKNFKLLLHLVVERLGVPSVPGRIVDLLPRVPPAVRELPNPLFRRGRSSLLMSRTVFGPPRPPHLVPRPARRSMAHGHNKRGDRNHDQHPANHPAHTRPSRPPESPRISRPLGSSLSLHLVWSSE